MWLAALRDVAIVLLAIQSLVIGILLALMLLQIRKLVVLLREEIAPLLDSANSTMHKVETTTHFVSDTVVNPLIELIGYTKGGMEAAKVLLSLRKRKRQRQRIRGIPMPSEPEASVQSTATTAQYRRDDL
jgi:hypothetical protein